MPPFLKYFVVLLPAIASLLNGFYIDYIPDRSALAWLEDVTRFVILPLVSLMYMQKVLAWTWLDVGLTFKPIRKNHGLERSLFFDCCLAVLIIVPLYQFSSILLGGFLRGWVPVRSAVDLGNGWLVAGYMAITAAVVEEVFCRGVLFKLVVGRGGYGNKLYVFSSSVIFSALHWEQGLPGVISAFAFGFLAAVLYLEFRYLAPLIFAHFIMDLYVFWPS